MKVKRMLAVVLGWAAVAGGAQDPLKTLPKNYWVEMERPWVRVVHVSYHAHELVPAHDHPGPPTLFVYLTDAGPVRFLHTESDVVDGNRPPVTVGQLRMSAGKAESHRVENMSDQTSEFLRVEFPTVPAGLKEMDARIAPPTEMFWAMEKPRSVVFEGEKVRVTRLGLAAGKESSFKADGGGHTVWLLVEGDGATVEGQAVHRGEAWDAATIAVRTGTGPLELLEVEVR